MAEAPPDPIPPNLARAFAEAVGMYGVWDPTNPDEQRLSVNGQPRSIAQVCWLVAHFIDRMREPVARVLRSHMDDRYSTLKEKLSENPSYTIGSECLLKLMDGAVQSVRRSGLKLVPLGKRTGRLASAKDLAKVNWKPWKGSKTGQYIPSGETIETLGITARIAYCTMLETRTRLIEMHRTIEHEAMDELMGKLAQATEDFKALASMCDQAYLRILAAGSKHALAGGKFKFQDGSSAPARASDL